MTTKIVSIKDPAEVIVATFDFATILAGDVIQGSPTVTVSSEADGSDQPAMLSGSASSALGIVSQKITGGTAGVDYRLRAVVSTVAGRTLAIAMILPVRVV